MKIKKQKIMRNKVKTLSIAFALAFTINSCGSDDDSPSEKNTPPVAKVKITGKATIGQTLTADTTGSSDADEQEITFKYQWYRSDDNKYDDKDTTIDKQTKSTYKLVNDDKDKYIIVKVIPNDGIEDGGAATAISPKIGGGAVSSVELKGTQTKDLKLTAGINYMVNEPLKMATGTTLTIEAGTTIKFKPGDNYIAILQGAKINAVGTAEKPIIFTCDNKEAGAWGGLFIGGKAKSTSGTSSLQSEIGGVTYGGSDPKDNSGKLQYVRIEYSGFRIDSKKECNALSLYTVGSGTTIDHIECFEGADDGIEFFGGSVSVSDVALINMEDDSIDWTEGFTGTVTNAYVQFKEAKTKDHGHDNGVEGDGYGAETGNKSNPQFFSNPTIENLTIKGTGTDTLDKNGIRLRVGTKGQFKNILIKGVKIGVRIDKGSGEVEVCKSDSKDYSATACTSQNPTAANVINKSLHFNGVKFEGIATELKNTTGNTGVTAAVLFENKGTATGAGDVSKWTWVTKGRIK